MRAVLRDGASISSRRESGRSGTEAPNCHAARPVISLGGEIATASLCARGALSADELYRRAAFHHLGERERIPVRQPDAAMRLRLADLLRLGRTVNSITLGR